MTADRFHSANRAETLERVFAAYHHPRYIHPDPLEIVRAYRRRADREVAALICSSLALGRVSSILTACRRVLAAVGEPRRLGACTASYLRRRLDGFVYRFFDTDELLRYLLAVGSVLRRYGSLEAAFAAGIEPGRPREPAGLVSLTRALRESDDPPRSIILPDPARGSAAKRLRLFLRWMVRADTIDPGGWDAIGPGELTVPVDVHLHRIARRLELTSRARPDARAGIEITSALRLVDREDPVRFDFSLTRIGIHPDGTMEIFDSLQRRKKLEVAKKSDRQGAQKVLGYRA